MYYSRGNQTWYKPHPLKRCPVSMKFTRATINRIFVVLVVFSNTFGNFLLAKGMNQMPDFMITPFLSYVASISTNLYIIGGVALLVAWMIAQLSMFTWADL